MAHIIAGRAPRLKSLQSHGSVEILTSSCQELRKFLESAAFLPRDDSLREIKLTVVGWL